MKPYWVDLRIKIFGACQKGEGSVHQLAERFSVNLSCVWLLLKRFRETGQADPKPHGGEQKAKNQGKDLEMLGRFMKEDPDATLMELGERLRRRTGIEVSRSTIALCLNKLNTTRKKKTFHAMQRDKDEDVRNPRAEFIEVIPGMEVKQLVFVDETGVSLGMSRTYSRAPKGQRAEGDKPCHPDAVSLIGALTLNGVTGALMIEGAVDGETFKGFIERLLVPTLRAGNTGLMDNLSAYRVEGIKQAIASKGATLEHLLPHSPQLSPIEPRWSQAKESLSKTAARTFNALQSGVKNALEVVTKSAAKGCFDRCSYCIEPESEPLYIVPACNICTLHLSRSGR